ncbi:DUF2254 family protein [Subtercola boreus]|uniref:DUF2254 family protein n=1 Tax=Subtercola boreus TaxID=120213 RepID=UPI00209BD8DD
MREHTAHATTRYPPGSISGTQTAQQLVEIAVRGLASGSDDPYTAVSALYLSGESLVPLFSRPAPGVRTYGLEHPVVVRRPCVWPPGCASPL